MFGRKKLDKKPDYTKEQVVGLGYKTDGRAPREKVGNGKQRMLLDSTKLLIDNYVDTPSNPYEAAHRINNNVYQMFNNDDMDAQKKKNKRK